MNKDEKIALGFVIGGGSLIGYILYKEYIKIKAERELITEEIIPPTEEITKIAESIPVETISLVETQVEIIEEVPVEEVPVEEIQPEPFFPHRLEEPWEPVTLTILGQTFTTRFAPMIIDDFGTMERLYTLAKDSSSMSALLLQLEEMGIFGGLTVFNRELVHPDYNIIIFKSNYLIALMFTTVRPLYWIVRMHTLMV